MTEFDSNSESIATQETYFKEMTQALTKFYDDQKVNPTYGDLHNLHADLEKIKTFLMSCVKQNITAPFISEGKPLDSLTADLHSATIKLITSKQANQQENEILVNNAIATLRANLVILLRQSAVYM